jgi:hypothetical protein
MANRIELTNRELIVKKLHKKYATQNYQIVFQNAEYTGKHFLLSLCDTSIDKFLLSGKN